MIKSNKKYPKKWEIIYFVTTKCNNCCAHCWSKHNFLGTDVSLVQHEKFLSRLNFNNVEELKLSGGEVTLYKDLPALINLVRKYMPSTIPLTIFSNGRVFFNKNGEVVEKVEAFKRLDEIVCKNKLNFEISIDEYHIEFFSKSHNVSFEFAGAQYCKLVQILVDYSKQNKNVCIKFKLHCDKGRLNWHRENIYSTIPDKIWDDFIIKSEGLVKSGNAVNIENSEELQENDFWSAFLMPGAEFCKTKTSNLSDCYYNNGEDTYLNPSTDGDGAVVLGWWNMINKKFLGGNIYDFIEFIK